MSRPASPARPSSGGDQLRDLPREQAWAMKRARWLAWLSLAYLTVSALVVFLLSSTSQAMQAAWIQDVLSMIPPIAYLIGVRVAGRPATQRHPFGYHQAMDLAHLASAVALFGFGLLLISQAVIGLVGGERPELGSFSFGGFEIWQGWVMIAVMAVGIVPAVLLGREKLKPAKLLHNKALFTDATMNKADWMSGVATIVGVAGIGLGYWWVDAVAAIVIGFDVLHDGFRNLRSSLTSMMDAAPVRLGTSVPHPAPALVNTTLGALPWVREVGFRAREDGQHFQVEAHVVPHDADAVSATELIAARQACLDLHWKISDVTVVVVWELSPLLRRDRAEPDEV